MAIPSGSGTEVLKRAHATGDMNAGSGVMLIDGVANHIYTILSIHVADRAGAAEIMSIIVETDGTAVRRLAHNIALPADGTYIHSDKFIMSGTDELLVYTNSASNCDVYVSYIDQDFS